MTRTDWRELAARGTAAWPWVVVRYRGRLAVARPAMARGCGRQATPVLVREDGGPAVLADAGQLEHAGLADVWACGDCDAIVPELRAAPLLACPWCGAPRRSAVARP